MTMQHKIRTPLLKPTKAVGTPHCDTAECLPRPYSHAVRFSIPRGAEKCVKSSGRKHSASTGCGSAGWNARGLDGSSRLWLRAHRVASRLWETVRGVCPERHDFRLLSSSPARLGQSRLAVGRESGESSITAQPRRAATSPIRGVASGGEGASMQREPWYGAAWRSTYPFVGAGSLQGICRRAVRTVPAALREDCESEAWLVLWQVQDRLERLPEAER